MDDGDRRAHEAQNLMGTNCPVLLRSDRLVRDEEREEGGEFDVHTLL